MKSSTRPGARARPRPRRRASAGRPSLVALERGLVARLLLRRSPAVVEPAVLTCSPVWLLLRLRGPTLRRRHGSSERRVRLPRRRERDGADDRQELLVRDRGGHGRHLGARGAAVLDHAVVRLQRVERAARERHDLVHEVLRVLLREKVGNQSDCGRRAQVELGRDREKVRREKRDVDVWEDLQLRRARVSVRFNVW